MYVEKWIRCPKLYYEVFIFMSLAPQHWLITFQPVLKFKIVSRRLSVYHLWAYHIFGWRRHISWQFWTWSLMYCSDNDSEGLHNISVWQRKKMVNVGSKWWRLVIKTPMRDILVSMSFLSCFWKCRLRFIYFYFLCMHICMWTKYIPGDCRGKMGKWEKCKCELHYALLGIKPWCVP